MTAQTEERAAGPGPDTDWHSRSTTRRQALRGDFAALRPTLLVVGTVLVLAVVAVGVSLVVWSPPSAGDIVVSETDYRIAMATHLPAGRHTIGLTNNGKVRHELILFRTNLSASALPVDVNGDVDEESPRLQNVLDSGSSLKPDETRSLPVKLTPGHYVAVCNLPAHYRLGMRLDLTIDQ